MAMKKLIEEVTEIIECEYGRASALFGFTNHSDHESYSVILEEVEESKAEIASFERELLMFWEAVKSGDSEDYKLAHLAQMYRRALLGACELIQTAVVVNKAALTIGDRGFIKKAHEGSQSV